MLVKYMPEGQEKPTEWDFNPDRVRVTEAEMIEKRSGLSWSKWVEAIQAGNANARRVLLWHLQKKTHHTLRLEDVDFCMGELEIDYSLTDLQVLRAKVEASSMSDKEKADVIDRLDLEIANRLDKEELDAEDLGKAPSNDAA